MHIAFPKFKIISSSSILKRWVFRLKKNKTKPCLMATKQYSNNFNLDFRFVFRKVYLITQVLKDTSNV